MNEVDRLRMERRKLEVEIKQIEDKLQDKKEIMKSINSKISVLQSEGKDDEFKATLFG